MAWGNITSLLVKEGVLSDNQLKDAIVEQKKRHGLLSAVLVDMGLLDEDTLLAFIARQFGLPIVDLQDYEFSKDALRKLSPEFCEKHNILPLDISKDGSLTLAIGDPTDLGTIDEVKTRTKMNVEVVIASEMGIRNSISRVYQSFNMEEAKEYASEFNPDADPTKAPPKAETENQENVEYIQSPQVVSYMGRGNKEEKLTKEEENLKYQDEAVKLLHKMILEFNLQNIDEIHLDPVQHLYRVRYRIFGTVHEIQRIPKGLFLAIAKKVESNSVTKYELGESTEIRDFTYQISPKQKIKIKSTFIKGASGNKIILQPYHMEFPLKFKLSKLPYEPKDFEIISWYLSRPQGTILLASGKNSGASTVLTSMLHFLRTENRYVLSMHSFVKYILPEITQFELGEWNLEISKRVHNLIKENNPDVFGIDDLFDYHLIESLFARRMNSGRISIINMPAENSIKGIFFLRDMGLKMPTIVNNISCVHSQALLKKVCNNCRVEDAPSAERLEKLGFDASEFEGITTYKGVGCQLCFGTGMTEYAPIYELLPMSPPIREAFLAGEKESVIRKVLKKYRLRTLRDKAFTKFLDGEIPLDEFERVSF